MVAEIFHFSYFEVVFRWRSSSVGGRLPLEVVFRWRSSSFDTFVHYDLIPIASVSNLSKIHPVVAEILNITNVYGGTAGWVVAEDMW